MRWMQGSEGLPTPSLSALGDFGFRLHGAYALSWTSPAFEVTGQFLTWGSLAQGEPCLLITLPAHFIYFNIKSIK